MAEAYAVFREAHAEEDGEQLMDVGLWMLDHAQWLAQESDFDVILLVLTRLLLALNQVEDAQWCRTQLDLDLVRADPVLHAELLRRG